MMSSTVSGRNADTPDCAQNEMTYTSWYATIICGFLISGLVGNSTCSIIIVFLGFGLLAGLGAGLAYNAVLSAVSDASFSFSSAA